MTASEVATALWTPTAERAERSRLSAFRRQFADRTGLRLDDSQALQRAALADPEAFWEALWQFVDVVGERGGGPALSPGPSMREAQFFPGARLNFAENLLRYGGSEPALIGLDEAGARSELSFDALRDAVAALSSALVAMGVEPGDRVVAMMPNVTQTVVIMLAAASVGATFASCSPDFGVAGVIDRLGPLAPRVLFVADAYRYKGKCHRACDKAVEIATRLPSLTHRVWVRHLDVDTAPAGFEDYDRTLQGHLGAPLSFARLPFSHPLYVLFSSGTTGPPKGFVHGAGGVLLQHLKEHQLHLDVRRSDRTFCFTTCGWMMWNWLVSGLASGATVVLFDGNPFHPSEDALLAMAANEGLTHFGASAKYFDGLRKARVVPPRALQRLRVVVSTGSPLVPEAFDYVYDALGTDLQLSSISGGTDIVSCFVLGDPTRPVRRGEIQGPGLGMDIRVHDAAGKRVVGKMGELVCASPFPSMPVRFWNDPGAVRYQAAYFERFPGVWCHGDFCMETASGGYVITGRSDTVLNPGGVRIGTAEIYRPTEALDEVLEAVAIGQPHEGDVRVILFVRLRDGCELDGALRARIAGHIRSQASPRHVPALIAQVRDIPRTRSGKISEVSVRSTVLGLPVQNLEALQNPEALAEYADHPALRSD